MGGQCVQGDGDDVVMRSCEIRPDLYISADVETDGPIPGPFSLLSFGLAVVARHRLARLPPREQTFYRELRPISDQYEDEAPAVNGLDRQRLLREGMAPGQAMEEAVAWVRAVSGAHRPVLVAYPVAFDWSFLYWYSQPEGRGFESRPRYLKTAGNRDLREIGGFVVYAVVSRLISFDDGCRTVGRGRT